MLTTTRRGVMAGGAALLAGMAGMRAAEAQARRILVITSNQDIPNFDPHLASGYSTAMAMRNVYDSLVRVEGNPPKPVPHLAQSWTMSEDGREYTFKLDPAAKFHDGSPVDAAAVKYSIERLLRLNRGNAWMVAGIVDPAGTEVVDAQTVRVKLLTPFVPFLSVLPWVWIVNPKQVEANKGSDDGQTWLRTNIAGSGAFNITRAEAGNLYQFERVADGWRKGGGNLTGAIWKITRETATQRLMVQRGEAQIAVDLTSEDMDALKGRPGVNLILEPEYRTFQIKMNSKHGPLADKNLRKAIACAFNYQGMLDVSGYAELMKGPLPESIDGFDKELPIYRTDLEKAKEFLAKSRSPNGGIKLTLAHVSGLEQQRRWALVLLDSLRALNIELDIKPMIWPDMVAACRSPETVPDFFMVYQTANYGDADNLAYAGFHSSRNGNWQNPVYANPEVDAVLDQARAEADPEKRRELYKKFQRIVMDDSPDIFGVLEMRKLAMRNNVKGFAFTPVASNAIELFPLSLG
ncbi:ABC transporter substrate-binding protein [Pseudoroseomonas ludipueritiae]|uniref:ABC transporter substrate-binding protein n=1 Tax=Pseudoroseomonas ludipueritiae TaxID=198093 RepID=A0ABR7R3C5_9PROT|nr:ABC transporter substrate-binding protein [Pseudoroseomonas ludipueritiae]MBC9176257.1 ABC transporter substrate-binding protein [Pseudoroseomonas ludipueritiae]